MELSIENQIFEQISHATKIVIALPEVLTPDAVSSGLAFSLFLKKMEKDVVVASSGQVPENLKFLPGSGQVTSELSRGGKNLVITVDTSVKKLDELSYETEADKVSIFLKAKGEPLLPEDVTFSSEKFSADLVILLDCKSLEDLGRLFEKNTDLFFETPKINIDTKAGNEYFGAANLVDVTATSVAEILSGLFEKHERQLIDEDIATCLLAGIIARTHSFQHVLTTPKAFLKASELIALGGRQQEIVKNVFKTKSLPLLKLWGRALARLKQMDESSAVYSLLNAGDFEKSEAADVDLILVLRELLENISGYKIVGLVSEISGDGVRMLAALHAQVNLEKFTSGFGAKWKMQNGVTGPYQIIDISLKDISLTEAEGKLINAIKTA